MTQVAVVTGAGSGIGRATAMRLLTDGYRVVGVDLGTSSMSALSAEADGHFVAIAGDVGERSTHEAAAGAAASLGQLAAWVNVAGVWVPTRAHDLDDEALEHVLRVNLVGTILGCSVACRTWLEAGRRGAIVNVSSIESSSAFPAALAYEASKSGVDAVTRQIAMEYGPAGIRCNAVRPGSVLTPMTEGYLDDADDRDAMLQSWADSAPLGRVAMPEEIATTISFLLSTDASFITGVALPIDGGATTRCYVYPPDPDIAR